MARTMARDLGRELVATMRDLGKVISVSYRSCDGCRVTRKYRTIEGARRWAHDMVGAHPDMGGWYAVSFDGIGTISVQGATLADLFPADVPAGPTEAEIEAANEDQMHREYLASRRMGGAVDTWNGGEMPW